jgi:predicted unusual protein kinase regulating ubiquinone biosynthesis (AarF/ABC1/UbiB family)
MSTVDWLPLPNLCSTRGTDGSPRVLGSAASFTKWAQWAATRNDMFPEVICDQLASDTPFHALAHNWDFGAVSSSLMQKGTILSVFDRLNSAHCASIAQITAVLLANRG